MRICLSHDNFTYIIIHPTILIRVKKVCMILASLLGTYYTKKKIYKNCVQNFEFQVAKIKI